VLACTCRRRTPSRNTALLDCLESSALIRPRCNCPTRLEGRPRCKVVLVLVAARLHRAARTRRHAGTFCQSAHRHHSRRAGSCSSRDREQGPSIHWPFTQVSIASAINSRDTSESTHPTRCKYDASEMSGPRRSRVGLRRAISPARRLASTLQTELHGVIVECALATRFIGRFEILLAVTHRVIHRGDWPSGPPMG